MNTKRIGTADSASLALYNHVTTYSGAFDPPTELKHGADTQAAERIGSGMYRKAYADPFDQAVAYKVADAGEGGNRQNASEGATFERFRQIMANLPDDLGEVFAIPEWTLYTFWIDKDGQVTDNEAERDGRRRGPWYVLAVTRFTKDPNQNGDDLDDYSERIQGNGVPEPQMPNARDAVPAERFSLGQVKVVPIPKRDRANLMATLLTRYVTLWDDWKANAPQPPAWLTAWQAFKDSGYYFNDSHGENIWVTPEGKIALVDVGNEG